MNSLSYEHLPLKSALSSIRLLIIQPAEWDAPLDAEMTVVSLANKPIYDTLSYVWETKSKKESSKKILINGTLVPLSGTLFNAIRVLRPRQGVESAPLVIWIDALCINQLCISERNQQVQIMGEIYSSSRQVHIWMDGLTYYCRDQKDKSWTFSGDNADYNTLWPEYCKHFNFAQGGSDRASIMSPSGHDQIDLFMAWIFRELADGTHLTEITAFSPVLCLDRIWSSVLKHHILSFFWDQWFYRLWVVQEAALAPVGWLHFGSVSIPLETMISAASNYKLHMHSQCCKVAGLSRDAIDQNLASLLDSFHELGELRQNLGSKPTVLELALQLMKRNATQPHDLVYALLGLASSDIVPDYEARIADLFVAVSEEHIRMRGARRSTKLQDLPSWVVDLSIPKTRSDPNPKALDWLAQMRHFSAPGKLGQEIQVTIIDRQLFLRGIYVDRIQAVSHQIRFDGGGSPNLFTLCDCDLVDEQISHNELHKRQTVTSWISTPELQGAPYPRGGTRINAWWRTMLRDHGWGSAKTQRATTQHLSTIAILNEFWATGQDDSSENISDHLKQSAGVDMSFFKNGESEDDILTNSLLIPTIHEHMLDTLIKRKVFLTEEGYLGIASREILERDEIFILPGSSVPIVLRPTSLPNSVRDENTHYKVVGDCFIHGFMDGEVVNSASFKMQDLVIS
ncbi:unnamed protein product [Clonostachys solani]|uniref:Heterokaryon incompatibility domain-containing protein n=1 Tax=Clonostachys solani TaxID=160281 RepID=A0A9N9ZM23_9HYPO|nr:unnamed protein product [Clonostachys solani]